jgi:tyrosyl-tRNA synthetase
MSESVPTYALKANELQEGIPAYILFAKAGLCKSRGEARRLISQGGGYINDNRLADFDQIVDMNDLENDSILLRGGKKRYLKITITA